MADDHDFGPPVSPPRTRRRWPLVAGGAAAGAAVVVLAGLVLGVGHGRLPSASRSAGTETTTKAASVPTTAAGPAPVLAGPAGPGAAPVPQPSDATPLGAGVPKRKDGSSPGTPPETGTIPPGDGSVAGEYPPQHDVADRLVAFWHRSDRDGARSVASDDTIDRLFALPWAQEDREMGCSAQPAGDVDCRWSYPEGVVHLIVDDRGSGLKAYAVVTTAG